MISKQHLSFLNFKNSNQKPGLFLLVSSNFSYYIPLPAFKQAFFQQDKIIRKCSPLPLQCDRYQVHTLSGDESKSRVGVTYV